MARRKMSAIQGLTRGENKDNTDEYKYDSKKGKK